MADSDACPACAESGFRTLFSGTDRLYRTTTKHFEIVECSGCRLLRIYPRPRKADLAAYYPKNYWFAPGEGTAERFEEAYRRFVLGDHIGFVRRAIEDSGSDGPVLDVGCGGGLFLKVMRDLGSRVVGLDSSPQAASVAWKVNSVPCLCGDLEQAPLPPGRFAAVTMFHVLEHLEDPGAYLRAAGELLAPEGRLVVQVPNAGSFQFLLLGENWSGLDIPRHLIDFRARDLENLLNWSGFEVLRRKHFSLRDNPAGLATSLAPGLDPMARRVRGVVEKPFSRLLKDLVYFGLVMASAPFAALEAACHAGSTIMMEARRKR